MLDLDKAQKELAEKTLDQIQRETAWTWASRAAVSFENVLSASLEHKVAVFACGQEYLHEAIEHAALVEDGDGDLVDEVKGAVQSFLLDAIMDIEDNLGIEL